MSFNSDREKEIFEGYGWEYNYVKRVWLAPDGFEIGIEDLMQANDEFGPNVEIAVIETARRHGRNDNRI